MPTRVFSVFSCVGSVCVLGLQNRCHEEEEDIRIKQIYYCNISTWLKNNILQNVSDLSMVPVPP